MRAPDPEATVTIVGKLRLPLENYPDNISTPAEAAAFDEMQLEVGLLSLQELVGYIEEGPDDVVVTIVADEP